MFAKNRNAGLLSASMLGVFILTPNAASPAALPCVNRAINWNMGGDRDHPHAVGFAAVALHSNGIAGYATGTVINLECKDPLFFSGGTCLKSDPTKALLSNRVAGRDQPFDVSDPLSLQVQVIPANDVNSVHLKQPNAIYKFIPACVGELVTGNDEFGNHWTISFQLLTQPPIIR